MFNPHDKGKPKSSVKIKINSANENMDKIKTPILIKFEDENF